MLIRDATRDDFEAITEIYNQIVLTSTAIYNDQPVSVNDRVAWWGSRRQLGFPVLVADEDGAITGFASFGEFRSWPGYRFTVEGTVHVRDSARGRGTGRSLLQALVSRATAMGKHVMVAGVDSENAVSLTFLKSAGFVEVAHFREVGFKFDKFLDLKFLQLSLSPPITTFRGDAEDKS